MTIPIGDYAMLSDRHSAALVSSQGSIDWLCMPRFDSPSIFASILDKDAGHWIIQPTSSFSAERTYVEGSMVLCTTFRTAGGTVVLREALTVPDTADPHRLGEHAPHLMVRSVTCTAGRVDLVMSFVPRPEYGLITPVVSAVSRGAVASGGAARLTLSSTAPLDVAAGQARANLTLNRAEVASFALQWSALGATKPPTRPGPAIVAALDGTVAAWQRWSAIHQSYQGPWREQVHHCGRVLQALSYQPTGAIVAAVTTSLPEDPGGERNWDYRYSWIRDASMTMQALWVAACPDEAYEFFDFMAGAASDACPDRPLQIMFGVGGEHDLSERTLTHLSGWRGSRPVRVGNGAWSQPQLDVYGELLDAAGLLRDQLTDLEAPTRDFLVSLADTVVARWQQPDQGIWEIRGEPRHFVHSKVMCWVALDRAIDLAPVLGAEDHVNAWKDAAEQVRTAVLGRGWNETAGAFTQSFEGADLDATVLLLPIVGFLPPDDPRVLASIDAVQQRLLDERGLVRRYHTGTGVDGLEGMEGTFLLCTFWLSQALAMAGRVAEGTEVFERALGYANDVGLLAEQIGSSTGEQLGNFPQAFSHIGLINAAWAIHQAQ